MRSFLHAMILLHLLEKASQRTAEQPVVIIDEAFLVEPEGTATPVPVRQEGNRGTFDNPVIVGLDTVLVFKYHFELPREVPELVRNTRHFEHRQYGKKYKRHNKRSKK